MNPYEDKYLRDKVNRILARYKEGQIVINTNNYTTPGSHPLGVSGGLLIYFDAAAYEQKRINMKRSEPTKETLGYVT